MYQRSYHSIIPVIPILLLYLGHLQRSRKYRKYMKNYNFFKSLFYKLRSIFHQSGEEIRSGRYELGVAENMPRTLSAYARRGEKVEENWRANAGRRRRRRALTLFSELLTRRVACSLPHLQRNSNNDISSLRLINFRRS